MQQVSPPSSENAIKHVHDPCIIRQGAYYYIFSTGPGVLMRRSHDLVTWEFLGQVFPDKVPAWALAEIPDSTSLWAPDIAFFEGKYHLYYSVSSFGKNRSVIGLATNKTLDPKGKDYAWKDEGKAFESFPRNDYNAIDSHVFAVGRDRMVFTFGSFWTGIKMVEMDRKTGKPVPGAAVRPIARRPAPGAVEAPFLIRNGDYYYLFVSFDFCCRGARSTYNIRVGRAKAVEGPYIDRSGVSLLENGGTPVLSGEGRYVGPGHCAVLKDGRRWRLVYHTYDMEDNGVPTLQIRPLTWDRDGWPVPGSPLG
jgi:arabinan endo-1,5-alpha-L-arabinosidase